MVFRVEEIVQANTPGPMSYRSVYKTYHHLLTQEAENSTDQFLRAEHELDEYQKVFVTLLIDGEILTHKETRETPKSIK